VEGVVREQMEGVVRAQAMEGVVRANLLPRHQFIELFANVVEHCREVGERLALLRPFSSPEGLVQGLAMVVEGLEVQIQEGVLEGHPDLAGRLADANLLTPESTREQRACRLDRLTAVEKGRLKEHNDRYRDKFGFTFIICARENKAAAILTGLDNRLGNNREEEIIVGMKEVGKIARLRSLDILQSLATQAKL